MNRANDTNDFYKHTRWYLPQKTIVDAIVYSIDMHHINLQTGLEKMITSVIKYVFLLASIFLLNVLDFVHTRTPLLPTLYAIFLPVCMMGLLKSLPGSCGMLFYANDKSIRNYRLSRVLLTFAICVFIATVFVWFPYDGSYAAGIPEDYAALKSSKNIIGCLLLVDVLVGGWPGAIGVWGYFLYAGMMGAISAYATVMDSTDWLAALLCEVQTSILVESSIPLLASLVLGSMLYLFILRKRSQVTFRIPAPRPGTRAHSASHRLHR